MTRRKKPTIEVAHGPAESPEELEKLIEQQYRITRMLEQDLAAARARQKEAN